MPLENRRGNSQSINYRGGRISRGGIEGPEYKKRFSMGGGVRTKGIS